MKCLRSALQKLLVIAKALIGRLFGIVLSFISSGLGLWYVLWFLAGSIYLYHNWDKAMVFVPFNGNALIFSVWLIIIFRPFIKDVDIPWLKFSFKEFEEKQKNVNEAKKELEELTNAENPVSRISGEDSK